jgi:hypothetical protein
MIVDVIKSSLGWGILILWGLFGYAIIKGDVTEHNTYGFVSIVEGLTILTTAYCMRFLSGSSKDTTHEGK